MTCAGNMRSGSITVNREAKDPVPLLRKLLQTPVLLFTEKITVKKTLRKVVINPTDWASLPWYVRWRLYIKLNLQYALVCFILRDWDLNPAVPLWICVVFSQYEGFVLLTSYQIVLAIFGFGGQGEVGRLKVHQHLSVLIKQLLCFPDLFILPPICVFQCQIRNSISWRKEVFLCLHRKGTEMLGLHFRTVRWVQCHWITSINPS